MYFFNSGRYVDAVFYEARIFLFIGDTVFRYLLPYLTPLAFNPIALRKTKVEYNLQQHSGESRDLNDRAHGISCRYSDKTSKQTYHTLLTTQPIFIKQCAHTSKLLEANVHLEVTPQYAVVFHTSPNKYCFQYFNFA